MLLLCEGFVDVPKHVAIDMSLLVREVSVRLLLLALLKWTMDRPTPPIHASSKKEKGEWIPVGQGECLWEEDSKIEDTHKES